MDRQADNTGDTDRWEDPRDTFGGETDMDPHGSPMEKKRHQHWRLRTKWTDVSGCKVVHDVKNKYVPAPKGWRDLTSWPGIPFPEDVAPGPMNIGNWADLATPENMLAALCLKYGRLEIRSRDLWNAWPLLLDVTIGADGITIALMAPEAGDREMK